MKKEKIMGTKRWIYWVSIGTVLIIIYKFLDNFSGIGRWIGNLFSVLMPFVVGILIAYILYVPAKMIENFFKKKTKLKHTRGLSIAIVYALFLTGITLLIKFIIPIIIDSVVDLVNNVQNYYNSISANESIGNIAPWVQTNILKPIVEYIQEIDFNEIFTPDKIKTYITSAFGAIRSILNVFIAFICSVYILAQRESIVRFINRLAKAIMTKSGYKKFTNYFASGNQIFVKYISSQVLDAIVVATITSIAMSIIGVKYSLLLGTLIGISNLVPYCAIIGIVIAIIITLLTGGWKQALIMAVVVTILQQIDANIINPRITSSRLKVSPLLIIFAITVGGAYFGLIGMLVAVPVATFIKLIIEDYIDNKTKEKDKEIENVDRE